MAFLTFITNIILGDFHMAIYSPAKTACFYSSRLFVNVLYSVIDRMYIGNIPEIGEQALAGIGICGPIVTMLSAFAAWVGLMRVRILTRSVFL